MSQANLLRRLRLEDVDSLGYVHFRMLLINGDRCQISQLLLLLQMTLQFILEPMIILAQLKGALEDFRPFLQARIGGGHCFLFGLHRHLVTHFLFLFDGHIGSY